MKTWNELPYGKKFVAAFSGGKDSTLALYEACKAGEVCGVIVMFNESGDKSGAHGLSRDFFIKQTEAMGLPVLFGSASWAEYETVFTDLLVKAKAMGAEVLVTGDLDAPEENCWHERVSLNAGLELCMPLWNHDHKTEPYEFVEAGFSSAVVCVNTEKGMKKTDLGRTFDKDFIAEMTRRGIDPSAEAGEFHTAAVSGPLFKYPLNIKFGEIHARDEYFMLDITAQ